MEVYFINKAIDKALKDYLSSKDNTESIIYNSFLVVIIRMLINIYGELDIINPYNLKSEEIFDNNLMRFGASKDSIDYLKKIVYEYYEIDRRNEVSTIKEDNIYFIDIQKRIIDLYTLKRLNYNISEVEQKEFYDLLYTPNCTNPLRLSYNYLNASNPNEVLNYYLEKLKETKEVKEEAKDLLPGYIYDLFKVNKGSLDKMNASDINNLNKQIYTYYGIDDKLINKEYLLEEKIKDLFKKDEVVTTGNGFVDILIILSIIVTVVMVIMIFVTQIS